MPDVEMKPAEAKAKEEKKAEPTPLSPTAEIKSNLTLIERAVSTLEPRFTLRVLRTLTALRKRIDASVLKDAIEQAYVKGLRHSVYQVVKAHELCADTPEKKSLLSWLPEVPAPEQSMEVDSTPASTKTVATPEPVPEGEIYLRLLILHHLLTSSATYSKALQLARETTEKMQILSRRSMDPIAAKVWFAVERAYELGGELAEARP
jgi:26S proteasome regulatory subunit N3